MEDDDGFGDLYSDVLTPLTASSTPYPPPVQPPATSLTRPIDLNLHSDDEEILYGAPNSNQPNFKKTLIFEPEKSSIVAKSSDSHRNLSKEEGLAEVENKLDALDLPDGKLERVDGMKLQEKGFEDLNDGIMGGRSDNMVVEKGNFTVIGDMDSEPMIPGLSTPRVSEADFSIRDEGSGDGDDWEDSDSEDDLQIVLNDNNHGPMAMDMIGVAGPEDDDEDEDGEALVIVADNDLNQQPVEEENWGQDAAQAAAEGEKKELGDAAKVNGGMVPQPPKIAYNNSHMYHPFHSQFKYVRPGAASMPGAAPVAPGGTPGQFRPLVNIGPIAGPGRGDWRPTGIKIVPPMPKSFHPGYGMPVWGNNALGRSFGLEFTLPSHKTIFEVDIDSFEEKPWLLPGIDISVFFNFGLNEETWKYYCKQLDKLRLEATMQRKIRVYESGWTKQEYDPDLPPELAVAAGLHDVSAENARLGKADAGQSELTKESARVGPQLPTGRAIQVETSYGERLPSIDTRLPRIRDSDAIIEIVLQDSVDDDSFLGNDVPERPENDPSREDLGGGHDIEEVTTQEDTKHFDSMPQAYNGKKRELVGRRAPFMNSVHDNITEGDRVLPFHSEAPVRYCPDSKGQTPVFAGRNFGVPRDERQTKGREGDRSPKMTPCESTLDKTFLDNQKEESVESVDGKHSPPLSSLVIVGITEELDFENEDAIDDDILLADGSSEMGTEEMALNTTTITYTLKDESIVHFAKKQKHSSQVEQPSLQEIDDGKDSKAARSSENSKARSGSSRDYQSLRDGFEEEIVQDGRSSHMGIIKRPLGEDEHGIQSKGHIERREMERHRMAIKGREDSYYHKSWDFNSAHHLCIKSGSTDRRRESDKSDGAWQRKDEDPHGRRTRADDMRKREHGEELMSMQWSKFRENESDKDEHQLRKQLDNGSWRGHHDKDMGSRHGVKDDNLKTRNENLDDLHSKNRKDEVHLKTGHAEKEEIQHLHRENTSCRKRERDDILGQRKRDDQARLRNDDQHSVRHKEEGWFQREGIERQRERDEWHSLKLSVGEIVSKREREGQGGVRGRRAAEDKPWVSHSRVKDEYKGSDREYNLKDTGRHSEQLKKRDRVENDSLSYRRGTEDIYARGNQLNIDERRTRPESESTRSDRTVDASDNHKVHEKKHKENTRKAKECEGDHNLSVPSRKNQENHSGRISGRVRLRGMIEQGSGELKIPVNRQSSRKHREDASSDDEQQDSRKGRSKLERWTSHKERDFSIGTKLFSSLKLKVIDKYKNSRSSIASKLPDESSKLMEAVDNPHPMANEKDVADSDINNVDAEPMEDRHLDTVAKLKKRSERFKLPMPSEKEARAIKKMESESLPLAQAETRTDSEIKQGRPSRKRRWTGN